MNRTLLLIFACAPLAIVATPAQAEADLSVAIITAPLTGCTLGVNEKVTLRLFNRGAALPTGSGFAVRYKINDAAAINEHITLSAPLAHDRALTYTFATPADLSLPGNYRIDAGVQIAADSNPANDSLNGHVAINFAPSVGGDVRGPEIAYSGELVLNGHIGTIRQWEQSTSNGERWKVLEGTDAKVAFDALTRVTLFRAEVKNGSCAPAYSSVWTINPS
jgi:hypothetical protein